MKFLGRAQSSRMKRDQKANPEPDPTHFAERRYVFDSIDEAVDDRKRSEGKRPNTSAGVDNRQRRPSSKTRNVIKDALKEATRDPTRSDDLHRAVQTVEITDGLDTFRFPTPSPRMPPRSATFQHSPSPLQYDSPPIGVAIGSPSNAPPNWGRSFTSDFISNRIHQPPSRAPPPPPEQIYDSPSKTELRRKKSGWKAFGHLFRKSSKRVPQEEFYKCKPGAEYRELDDPAIAGSAQILTLAPSEAPSPVLQSPRPNTAMRARHSRTSSLGRGGSRLNTPDRASFMPHIRAKMMRVPTMRNSTTPSPRSNTHRASADTYKPIMENCHPLGSPGSIAIESIPIPRTPRLELEFPKPEFDRYSVMFEKLLTIDSKPSLLERRQSRLQKRKSMKQVEDGENSWGPEADAPIVPLTAAQRSMPSPHISRTMSILIEGQRPKSSKGESSSTAMHRPRPIQRSKTAPAGAMSPLSAAFMRARQDTMESSPETHHSDFSSDNSLPATPTTITTCTDTESIKRSMDQNEPAWDMITSKPVKVVSPVEERPEPYPRVMSPADLERQMVQVSVARQVSVNRARSRVSRAVSSKQPLRPRVVELSKNRKSTVGVLVTPDEDIEQLPVLVLAQAAEASGQDGEPPVDLPAARVKS